jgi:uncharacterized protein
MPLGKFLKRLTRGFHQKSSKLANIPELSEVEESTLVIPIEASNLEATMPEDSSLSTTTSFVDTPLLIISQGRNMINISMLQQELQNFVSGASDVQGAALVTPDGLALASALPAGMDEERTAAMSASMLSLGERIGHELARGVVERIVVEGEKGYGVLVNCGNDAVLLVLAGSGVKQGILFLEVKRVVAKLAPLLG